MSIDEQVAKKLGTEVKPYSTDLKASWEIVEKHKGYFDLTFRDCDLPWSCSIDGVEIDAKTAPMAICLAFLKLP